MRLAVSQIEVWSNSDEYRRVSKGKLSFPISKILHPDHLSPTLTATDSSKLAVIVGNTIRQLNETELKRLCGFPLSFSLPDDVNMYDLFGNMVCPPVITEILESLLSQIA
jgi:DNA (cytosine-5)-methyltransferase 1